MGLMGWRAGAALGLCLGALSGSAQALDAGETDPRAIMRAVAAQDRGDQQVSVLEVTVTHPSGRHLKRIVRRSSLEFAQGTRTLLRFEAPARLRDTAVLSIDYREGQGDDERWLYLPSLQTTSRILEPHESVPFLGTDLTDADLVPYDLEVYDYALVKLAESVDDEVCWVLERRPRTEAEARSTGYVKSRLWVSKTKLLTVQAKHWVENGRKLKYLKFSEFEKIDTIWLAKRLAVRVVKTGKVESTTIVTTRDVRFNQADVTAESLSVEGLRGARPGGTEAE